jgi:tripeptidyl-peptidase-1
VSHPSSPHFGKHWSRSEVEDWFAPAPEAYTDVVSWLNSSGVHPSRLFWARNGGWLALETTISEVETLLATTYYEYNSEDNEQTQHGCEEYSIPPHLIQHIDLITPTIHLDTSLRMQGVQNPERDHTIRRQTSKRKRELISIPKCGKLIVPDCIRSLYRMPSNQSINPHPKSTIGVLQMGWVSWLPGDLDSFFRRYAPSLVGVRPIMESINGGERQERYQDFVMNGEADLDFEYTMALSNRAAINYQIGLTSPVIPSTLNPLLAALDRSFCPYLNGTRDGVAANSIPYPERYNKTGDCGTIPNLPAVLSIRYALNEEWLSPGYLTRHCLEFLKLGLQGVTVIASSADCGAAGQNGTCLANDRFNPTSPSTCPYVTSVGATELPSNATSFTEEKAYLIANEDRTFISSSGGGFSNVFGLPAYQEESVQKYLDRQGYKRNDPSLKFNPKGRGIPDISANGRNYVVVINGKLQTVHGTSASAPTVVSLITLINDEHLHTKKSTVGFLNPVLYNHPLAMNNITKGENFGCNGILAFNATQGWDPVTGLGTIDFQRLLKVYQDLP